MNTIRVGIADMKLCKSPDKITTIGLGSCVGIVIYDDVTKISGLVHIMLPDSTRIRNNQNRLKFADTGIDDLYNDLVKEGIDLKTIKSKIAGGAKMFNFQQGTEIAAIGDQNVEASKKKLKALGVRVVSEDVGLNYGRTIIFDPDTKELSVITAGKNKKII